MKTTLLALAGLSALLATGFADDVAVLDIRNPDDAHLERVGIEFYADAAPRTVENFKKLANSKFYDGVTFHRIFSKRLVQTGDPLSKTKNRSSAGTGGPGYTLPPEINHHHHDRGAVAAARLNDTINPSRLSNGSQFYVTLTGMPNLDGQYTVFGHVFLGLDYLDAISEKEVDSNDAPLERVTIVSAQIVPRSQASTVKPRDHSFWKFLRFGL